MATTMAMMMPRLHSTHLRGRSPFCTPEPRASRARSILMDEMHEYRGDFTFKVTEGHHGPTLRFLREDEVVTEIHLSRTGAERLGLALLRRT
jgi:hypothetical protein